MASARLINHSRANRRGFSFVELLIVVGIIAVLVGLLMPMLSSARQSANQAKCLSNLKQIGAALWGYQMSNDGCFPGDSHTGSAGEEAIWLTRIRPYAANNQKIFFCPSRPDDFQWEVTPGSGAVTTPAVVADLPGGYKLGEQLLLVTQIQISYGYNAWGCVTSQPTLDSQQRGLGASIDSVSPTGWGKGPLHERRIGKIVNSSQMIAVTDRTPQTPGTSGTISNCNVDPTNPVQCPASIHNNGANVLFTDAHAEWMPQQKVCAFNLISGSAFAQGSQQWYGVATLWNSDGQP